MLIQKGANVNHIPSKQCGPVLMIAAKMGYTDVVETLIEEGANIDYKDSTDLSVLETALVRGKTDVAKLLIEKGAKTDGALMQAFKINCTEVVDILLNKETDIKHKDKYGKTLLMIAAACGQTELMSNLIDKGSDIEERDNEGMTALMCASRCGCLKAVDILIEKEAHVNEKSNDGRTSFLPASSDANKDVESLIENVAFINRRSNDGLTALMYASQNGCTDVITLLIDRGADLNMKAMNGDTALILATTFGHTRSVEVLEDKGADVHIQGNDGMSAREIAIMYTGISKDDILNIFGQKRTMISKYNEKEDKSINKPTCTDTVPSGQETIKFQDKVSIKPSGESDVNIFQCLSGDLQDQIKMVEKEMKDLNKRSKGNVGVTDQIARQQDDRSLGQTHRKHPIKSRKRKVTKQCHLSDLEVSIPKDPSNYGSNVKRHQVPRSHGSSVKSHQVPRSHGSNVKSHQVPRSHGSNAKSHNVPRSRGSNVKIHKGLRLNSFMFRSSKNVNINGSNVRSDIYREDDDQRTLHLQNLLVHSFGTSKFSSDTVFTENVESVGKVATDQFENGDKKVANVLEEFDDNFIPKRVKSYTRESPATGIQKENTPLNSTSYEMDKIVLQLAELFRNISHPPPRRRVFKLILINNVRHAHLKNPSCVNIRNVRNCSID